MITVDNNLKIKEKVLDAFAACNDATDQEIVNYIGEFDIQTVRSIRDELCNEDGILICSAIRCCKISDRLSKAYRIRFR